MVKEGGREASVLRNLFEMTDILNKWARNIKDLGLESVYEEVDKASTA